MNSAGFAATLRDAAEDFPSPGAVPCDPGVNELLVDPHRIAREYLAKEQTVAGKPTLLFWRDSFHEWDAGRYSELPASEVCGRLSAFAKVYVTDETRLLVDEWQRSHGIDPKTGKTMKKPVSPPVSTRLVADVRQALSGATLLPSAFDAPAWLSGEGPFPAEEVLAAKNGLLHLPTLRFLPHTPDFFSPNVLEFDFDPDAPEPFRFLKFLKELWGDDRESIRELRKWFGYALLPDTRQQKILALIGPKRSGKGTIARVQVALLGAANVAGPTLSSLGSNFGLSPLLGKRLAIISDARLSRQTDTATVIERLLSISGEDSITVDRKHLSPVTVQLKTRIMLISNELPRLPDSAAALSSRLVTLALTRSFYGVEDHGLMDRLREELPGILLHFAIPGYAELQEDGRFREPTASRELREEMERLSSPISAFVREECILTAGASIKVQEIYEAWKRWCEVAGRKPGDAAGFSRDLHAAQPFIRTSRPREGESRYRVFEGLRLRLENEREVVS